MHPQARTHAIRTFVEANPGCKAPAIAATINTATSNIASQLAEMVQAGHVYRTGLRCDYVYYATAGERDAAAAQVLQQQTQQRQALAKAAKQRRAQARRERLQAKRAGQYVKRITVGHTWADKLMHWLETHQGATRAQMEKDLGSPHHSIGHTITALKAAGRLWHTGKRGDRYDVPKYFSDVALYVAAAQQPRNVLAPSLKTKATTAAKARREERQQRKETEALQRRQLREAAKITKDAARQAARLERERTEADAKRRRQAAADAKREAREAAERAKQDAKAKREALAQRVTTKTVAVSRAAADAWRTAAPIITGATKITVCPSMPDRFAVNVPRGAGAISQDQMARRRGADAPTRLAGAYA